MFVPLRDDALVPLRNDAFVPLWYDASVPFGVCADEDGCGGSNGAVDVFLACHDVRGYGRVV